MSGAIVISVGELSISHGAIVSAAGRVISEVRGAIVIAVGGLSLVPGAIGIAAGRVMPGAIVIAVGGLSLVPDAIENAAAGIVLHGAFDSLLRGWRGGGRKIFLQANGQATDSCVTDKGEVQRHFWDTKWYTERTHGGVQRHL